MGLVGNEDKFWDIVFEQGKESVIVAKIISLFFTIGPGVGIEFWVKALGKEFLFTDG